MLELEAMFVSDYTVLTMCDDDDGGGAVSSRARLMQMSYVLLKQLVSRRSIIR